MFLKYFIINGFLCAARAGQVKVLPVFTAQDLPDPEKDYRFFLFIDRIVLVNKIQMYIIAIISTVR